MDDTISEKRNCWKTATWKGEKEMGDNIRMDLG
jgi:hypothetical protein